MASPRPSMRQIAAEAGVSVMAVSYALRGVEGVSEATRSNVLGIAESLGYRPDPLLSHLMHHLRTKRAPKNPHNVALLHWRRDPYRELVLTGARARAEKHGYRLDVIEMSDDSPPPRVLRRMLNARGVAGLILGPSPVRDFSALLDWERYAVVLTSYSVISPHFHRVVPNQFLATQLAIRALHVKGHRRVGLVVPAWVEERVNYFHSVALYWEAARERTEPLVCYHDPETQPPANFQNWFRKKRPDALVLCSPLDYESALCNAIGRPTVARLGIVSLGYDTQCANTTTVDYQPALIGTVAVDQLINQLFRGERGVPQQQQTLSIEGRWIDAPSEAQPQTIFA